MESVQFDKDWFNRGTEFGAGEHAGGRVLDELNYADGGGGESNDEGVGIVQQRGNGPGFRFLMWARGVWGGSNDWGSNLLPIQLCLRSPATSHAQPPSSALGYPPAQDPAIQTEVVVDSNGLNVFQFLAQMKTMDYSLLVGIHDVDRAEQEEMEVEEKGDDEESENDGMGALVGSYGTPPDSPGNMLNFPRIFGPGEFDPTVDVYAIKSYDLTLPNLTDAPKKEVYFMAIIDILTHYDAKKKAAHAAKTVKHGAGAEISTVNPEQYSKRFLEFLTNILT